MQLDESLRECEADAESARGMLLRRAQLREHAKYRRQVFRRDADAIVLDGDDELILHLLGRHADGAAGMRVLRGVGQQIREHLRKTQRIPIDAQIVRDLDRESMLPFVDEWSRGLD